MHKIEYIKKSHNKFVSKIVNVSDLDQIKLFTNKKLYIKNSDLPKLSDKEVYWHELKGMNVFVNKTNENLGVVKEINNFGSDDCLLIFPAGLVSRLQDDKTIQDLTWKRSFVEKWRSDVTNERQRTERGGGFPNS